MWDGDGLGNARSIVVLKNLGSALSQKLSWGVDERNHLGSERSKGYVKYQDEEMNLYFNNFEFYF